MKRRRWQQRRRQKDRIAIVIWIVYAVLLVLALRDAGVIPL